MLKILQQLWSRLKLKIEDIPDRASLEFLPAALEVIETPPAPLGRAILWAIVSFFVIAVLWASIGKVDIVAVAQGKIVPSGRVKIIQPLETGVVKAIFVEDGQQVEKGQALVELDSTVSGADKERLESELVTLQLDRVRLKELINRIQEPESRIQERKNDEPDLENELYAVASEFCILNSEFCSSISSDQRQLFLQRFSSQIAEYDARQNALQNEIEEKNAEQKSTEERIAQLEETIPLISERTAAIKKMLASGVVSRADWLKVEEDRINQGVITESGV